MICSDQGSRKVTKIKCVFRKLLCLPSCMYKRSDQEKMQWSPTWQVYQQQAKVIWSFSLMAKQPFLLEERSPGQPRWSQLNQQGYLITMRIRNTLFLKQTNAIAILNSKCRKRSLLWVIYGLHLLAKCFLIFCQLQKCPKNFAAY